MNQIPEAMVWKGLPLRLRIQVILGLTRVDAESGKRYWRISIRDSWRPLWTEEDFRDLNRAADLMTEALQNAA